MKVCVVGCLHGELDKVYSDIAKMEADYGFKTDIVLCCGDFQSIRNAADLQVMSVPPKYRFMGDFWRYYAGKVKAPILTLFVGGNHEASNYLQELPYGGWVAPNIYYMGYGGVFQFGGLRIAGLSGIYKQYNYPLGHFEHPPYNDHTKRSAYHLRSIDTFRLFQIRRSIDIVLSHDWPRGIYHFGDWKTLVKRKPHFTEEVRTNTMGSAPGENILVRLRPRYWFAAHLHCKFPALVQHILPSGDTCETRFLALDKCLPNREYLQFLDIEPQSAPNHTLTMAKELSLDPEWLCILKKTDHLMSLSKAPITMPVQSEMSNLSATPEDISNITETFGGQLTIPENFEVTSAVHQDDQESEGSGGRSKGRNRDVDGPILQTNPQTELICAMLEIVHPNASFLGQDQDSEAALSGDFGGSLKKDIGEDNAAVSDDGVVDEEVEGTEMACQTGELSSVSLAQSENPEAVNIDNVDDDSCTSSDEGL